MPCADNCGCCRSKGPVMLTLPGPLALRQTLFSLKNPAATQETSRSRQRLRQTRARTCDELAPGTLKVASTENDLADQVLTDYLDDVQVDDAAVEAVWTGYLARQPSDRRDLTGDELSAFLHSGDPRKVPCGRGSF